MLRYMVLIVSCCMPVITLYSAEPKGKKGLNTLLRAELKAIENSIQKSSSANDAMGIVTIYIIESSLQAQLSTSEMIAVYAQMIAQKFNLPTEQVAQQLKGIMNEAELLSFYSNETTNLILSSDTLYQAVVAVLSFIESSPDQGLLTSKLFTNQLINKLSYRFEVSPLLAILHLNTPQALALIPQDIDPLDRSLFIEAIENIDGSLGSDRAIQFMVDHFDWKKENSLKSTRILKNDKVFRAQIPVDNKTPLATITSGKNSKGNYRALTGVTQPRGAELYVTAMNTKGVDTALFNSGTILIDLSKQCDQITPFNILFMTNDEFIIYGKALCDGSNYFFVARFSNAGQLLQFMRYQPTPKRTPVMKKDN